MTGGIASTGEDAALSSIEAAALIKTGQLRAAAAAAERAVEADPGFKDAYIFRIGAALEARDNAGTLEWLKRAVEQTGMRVGDLRQNPTYARFVKSPQYQEWLAWTAAHPGT
jgi:hypothetical protein